VQNIWGTQQRSGKSDRSGGLEMFTRIVTKLSLLERGKIKYFQISRSLVSTPVTSNNCRSKIFRKKIILNM
jgi:hypothetical protein